jgi:hypothetical protein
MVQKTTGYVDKNKVRSSRDLCCQKILFRSRDIVVKSNRALVLRSSDMVLIDLFKFIYDRSSPRLSFRRFQR